MQHFWWVKNVSSSVRVDWWMIHGYLQPSYRARVRNCSWYVIVAAPIKIVIHEIPRVEHVSNTCIVPAVSVTDGVRAVSILTSEVTAQSQSRIV